MVDANIPDIALEPDKTVKKVSHLMQQTLFSDPSAWVYEWYSFASRCRTSSDWTCQTRRRSITCRVWSMRVWVLCLLLWSSRYTSSLRYVEEIHPLLWIVYTYIIKYTISDKMISKSSNPCFFLCELWDWFKWNRENLWFKGSQLVTDLF